MARWENEDVSGLNLPDENKTNALYVMGEIYDHLKLYNETTLLGFNFNNFINMT